MPTPERLTQRARAGGSGEGLKVLLLALMLTTVAVVAAPEAAACTDDPCDPPPMPLCPPLTDDPLHPVAWAKQCIL